MSSRPNAIDLFCGCGGMSLGAARAGFCIAGAIDFDAKALASHKRNFPHSAHYAADLAGMPGSQVLENLKVRAGEVEVCVGGPPCQGFSTMGKRNPRDERNLLLADFLRIVGEIGPSAFVLENVPALLHERHRRLLDTALLPLESAYDILDPQLLKATDAGAPTVRMRMFVVGFRKSIAAAASDFWDPSEKTQPPVVRKALDGLPVDVASDWRASRGGVRTVRITRQGAFFEAASARIPVGVGDPAAIELLSENFVTGCIGTRHSDDLISRYAGLEYGESDGKTKSVKLDPEGYCPTLRAGTGPDRGSFQAVRPIHYLRPRVITPREAARLQGFPDWYQFDQTKWHSFRQIGNSVSPLVAEFVLRRVRKVLQRG
jgi:DNA (cytosine-5)-methyltransferase 1